jgi:hypothetical protein
MSPHSFDHLSESVGLGVQDASAKFRQSVVASARIVTGGPVVVFLHQAVFEQTIEVAVERAWSNLIASAGIAFDLGHDGIAVALLPSQRQKDMKHCGRERQLGFDVVHVSRI